MVGIADGKPMIWLIERRTVSVRHAFGRIGRSGGPFEGLRTPNALGTMMEGLGVGLHNAHLHHDINNVGQIAGVGVRWIFRLVHNYRSGTVASFSRKAFFAAPVYDNAHGM
jgi:hypothetical protein